MKLSQMVKAVVVASVAEIAAVDDVADDETGEPQDDASDVVAAGSDVSVTVQRAADFVQKIAYHKTLEEYYLK